MMSSYDLEVKSLFTVCKYPELLKLYDGCPCKALLSPETITAYEKSQALCKAEEEQKANEQLESKKKRTEARRSQEPI